jgi:hypothetical protein
MLFLNPLGREACIASWAITGSASYLSPDCANDIATPRHAGLTFHG